MQNFKKTWRRSTWKQHHAETTQASLIASGPCQATVDSLHPLIPARPPSDQPPPKIPRSALPPSLTSGFRTPGKHPRWPQAMVCRAGCFGHLRRSLCRCSFRRSRRDEGRCSCSPIRSRKPSGISASLLGVVLSVYGLEQKLGVGLYRCPSDAMLSDAGGRLLHVSLGRVAQRVLYPRRQRGCRNYSVLRSEAVGPVITVMAS